MHTHRSRLALVAVLLFTIAGGYVRPQSVPAPILLIVNPASANPYGPFLAEILRTEGINSFSTADISTVTATDLTNASVVILAETNLDAGQATLLSNYIAGGGRLVAMRPDSQLLPALGATAAGTSTTEGYLAINPSAPSADGFTTTTLPFHGTAQNVQPDSNASVLATLYSDANTSTAFPAILRFGTTATWTYDLARSVVYARQGDPANATDRDGQPPFRTTDIFFNAVDKDRIRIPHADVQMRLFARVVNDLLSNVMPLPRLWYFPGTNRTLMVMTADSHANPSSWFEDQRASVEARGGRISFYVDGGGPSTTDVQTWRAAGHEVGMHPAAYQFGRTLDAAFAANQNFFVSLGIQPPSRTTRMHQLEWLGWVDAAKIEAARGVALDTSYYTWGPGVTYSNGQQAHGYITGSGLPMRFVDDAGAVVPVYQQVTSLVDEALVIGDLSEHLNTTQALAISRQLIDDSQAGNYAAITTQLHVDYFGFGEVRPWAEGTMDYAQSLGVPMWTAERLLNFTEARAASTMSGLVWSPAAKQLTFSLTIPASGDAQSLMLPTTYAGRALTALTIDGVTASGTPRAITGRPMIFFNVGTGAHSIAVTYDSDIPPDERPPVAVADTAGVIQGYSVSIPVLANDSDPDGDPISIVSTTAPAVGSIVVNSNQTITYTSNPAVCGAVSFTYTIDDGRGGTAVAPVSVTVACSSGQITHTSVADFSGCSLSAGTIVTGVAGGEVRLAGVFGDEYAQSSLDSSKWTSGTWSGGSYSPAPAGGVLSVSNTGGGGAYVRSVNLLPATTLESTAQFAAAPWQHLGWGTLNFESGYAIFSTYSSSSNLFARTSAGGSEQRTDLGPVASGFHLYRIDRQSDGSTDVVRYYIDGVLRAEHTGPPLPPMYVYQSNNDGRSLDVDRVWVYPNHVLSGSFQSCLIDIGTAGGWLWTAATWQADVPAGSTLQVRTRTSNDATTWSSWSSPLTMSGQAITSPSGRYLQYVIDLSTNDANRSPVVNSMTVRYADSSIADRPPVAAADSVATEQSTPVAANVLANDIDLDGDPLAIVNATTGSLGSVVVNAGQTITYTPNFGACGTDAFSYTIDDGRGGTASANVTVAIRCVSGQSSQNTAGELGGGIVSGTILTQVGDGEVRLAGTQGDEFSAGSLNSGQWEAGTWAGGSYAPTLSGGVMSIADPAGAFVRSSATMPVTTLDARVRFTAGPWQHVGWANLNFEYGYLIFSTFNTSTNLFARSYTPSGEVQTNLGPIPSGFHQYRIDRQASTPTADVISYYIDSALVAQHTVPTAPAMYVYQSNADGATLDIDRLWVYPNYTTSGSYQSVPLDSGSVSTTWTRADWTAAVPGGTSLQVRTRTSTDATAWTAWSAPLTTSGAAITSPPGRYLQYLLELATSDPALSPVVDSVVLHYAGIIERTQNTAAELGGGVPAGAMLTQLGNGEIRLAGTQGDEFGSATLDPVQWTSGTWDGGSYTPALAGGVMSIADPAGAYVRSTASVPVTTLDARVRFASGPWQHVGWANLNFEYGYLIFSTFNTSTNLFARSYTPTGELQTNLGPIPSGFHQYRIERQTSSATEDLISYYIDGAVVAQHTVPTVSPMYVYQSNSGGGVPRLDIDRLWIYPSYTANGTYQSTSIDGGSVSTTWTSAEWTAAVPVGTLLQVRTRTSTDATTWSAWSAPLTTSGAAIASPPGRYVQYLLEFSTTDPVLTPVVDSVTLRATIE